MKKPLLIKAAAGALLSGVFALATTPDTDTPLSTQRGDATAAKADIARLTEEGKALNREYNQLEFLANSLKNAQHSLTNRQDNVVAQVRELDTLHSEYQERLQARTARVSDFHDELLNNRNISEADAKYLYTVPFEGSYYAHYYTQTMAYRDECNSKTSCMEEMQNSETKREIQAFAATYTTTLGSYAGSMFGLSALAGWRRRRKDNKQQQQHAASLGSVKDMLTPKSHR